MPTSTGGSFKVKPGWDYIKAEGANSFGIWVLARIGVLGEDV
jgi:hypothetical protein